MRKRLTPPTPGIVRPHCEGWLDLERVAAVEVTSEEENSPVESALVLRETRGWRAAIPGTQTIRLVFDQPQKLRHISLVFEETERTRTQEFVLRWSSDGGRSFREIVRQQWNFSPPETVRELQGYQVELSDVTVLELSLLLTSAAEWLAPQSRLYACLDSVQKRTVCAMKRASGSFSLSATIEIPGEQEPDSGSNESTEKRPVPGRIRFFGSEQYSRKPHQ